MILIVLPSISHSLYINMTIPKGMTVSLQPIGNKDYKN